MKKVLCIFLSLVMLAFCVVSAFANVQGASVEAQDPVIHLSGDSQEIAYDNGTKTFSIDKIAEILLDGGSDNALESAKNILYPFLVKGVLFNDWDDYYDAVYKELSEAYDPIQLDKNGNPKKGGDSGIPAKAKAYNEESMIKDRKSKAGTYSQTIYRFNYDWRLDPREVADELHEYIEGVKKITKHDKVSISARCLGCNVVLAYFAKYGTDGIKGFGIEGSTSLGAEFLSGMVSGKFGVDGNSISRLATYFSEREQKYEDVAEFATALIDLLDNTGVLDGMNAVTRKLIYSKIEYGIVSALSLSTLMTYPCYWALVSEEDFDTALQYVFGAPGSAKREEYKGLIDKITTYNEEIKKNAKKIFQDVSDNGVNICIISKYGIQMIPFIEGGTTYIGDEYVSAAHSSFGATTGNVYNTLPEAYIENRVAEGKGKYISADKQIDASTCLFPDYTWFFKGVPHGYYTNLECNLLMTVIDADKQLTINDFECTQFVGYDYHTKEAFPLTEENCDIEYWTADEKIDHPKTLKEKIHSFIVTFKKLISGFINVMKTRVFKK